MKNSEVVESFYKAFQNQDSEAMASFYSKDIIFKDPVFGELRGNDVKDMWRFLIERSNGNIDITFSILNEENNIVNVHWEAKYHFSKTKRFVHNKVNAIIEVQDGKIVKHIDHFNFYRWSRMAFGSIAYFIGFTTFFQKKINLGILNLFKKYQLKKR